MQMNPSAPEPSRRRNVERFHTVTLTAERLEAAFAPGLGMAGVSLRHAGEELLDRRAGLRAYASTGAVMGILTLLYAAAWCTVAVGLVIFDWRFWHGRSPSPQPANPGLPLAGRA